MLIPIFRSIGNLLGEKKAKRAGIAANTAILMALVVSLVTSLLFMIFRNTWGKLFNNDDGALFTEFYVTTLSD